MVGWNGRETVALEWLQLRFDEARAHSFEERPTQYRDVLRSRMRVRPDLVAVGEAQPQREGTGLTGIPVEDGDLGAWKGRWRRTPHDPLLIGVRLRRRLRLRDGDGVVRGESQNGRDEKDSRAAHWSVLRKEGRALRPAF